MVLILHVINTQNIFSINKKLKKKIKSFYPSIKKLQYCTNVLPKVTFFFFIYVNKNVSIHTHSTQRRVTVQNGFSFWILVARITCECYYVTSNYNLKPRCVPFYQSFIII